MITLRKGTKEIQLIKTVTIENNTNSEGSGELSYIEGSAEE